jgi:glycosyltransferase involved in cell wall biosynthesis
MNQTWRNIEIIVVNDGSKDGTREYLDSLKNITVFHNDAPKGGPYSRNLGANYATGAFISFLDDDDELLPEKVERQMNWFENNPDSNTGVLTCDMLAVRPDKEYVIENRKRGNVYRDLLQKYCVQGIHTMLIQREVFESSGGFDLKLESNQEYDLMIRMAEKVEFDFIPEVLAKVYLTPGQISLNFRKKRDGTITFIRKNKYRYKAEGTVFYIREMMRLWGITMVYQLSVWLGVRFYRLVFP